MILVYEGTVDLSCFVFHPWTAARRSVNAEWLLTASMSWVVFCSTEEQISLVQFETPVGHLCGTRGGAIMMGFQRISRSLSGHERCWVDRRVAEWI
jgi:hypothetical protein